jgi:hypothetical protein
VQTSRRTSVNFEKELQELTEQYDIFQANDLLTWVAQGQSCDIKDNLAVGYCNRICCKTVAHCTASPILTVLVFAPIRTQQIRLQYPTARLLVTTSRRTSVNFEKELQELTDDFDCFGIRTN